MESYIVQLDFTLAFDRASHSGLLFKLKSIGVGGSVLSICTEFLSDRPLLFILYTSEMFELVQNRLFAYEMTPPYWQLFASQQTDLPWLPS